MRSYITFILLWYGLLELLNPVICENSEIFSTIPPRSQITGRKLISSNITLLKLKTGTKNELPPISKSNLVDKLKTNLTNFKINEFQKTFNLKDALNDSVAKVETREKPAEDLELESKIGKRQEYNVKILAEKDPNTTYLKKYSKKNYPSSIVTKKNFTTALAQLSQQLSEVSKEKYGEYLFSTHSTIGDYSTQQVVNINPNTRPPNYFKYYLDRNQARPDHAGQFVNEQNFYYDSHVTQPTPTRPTVSARPTRVNVIFLQSSTPRPTFQTHIENSISRPVSSTVPVIKPTQNINRWPIVVPPTPYGGGPPYPKPSSSSVVTGTVVNNDYYNFYASLSQNLSTTPTQVTFQHSHYLPTSTPQLLTTFRPVLESSQPFHPTNGPKITQQQLEIFKKLFDVNCTIYPKNSSGYNQTSLKGANIQPTLNQPSTRPVTKLHGNPVAFHPNHKYPSKPVLIKDDEEEDEDSDEENGGDSGYEGDDESEEVEYYYEDDGSEEIRARPLNRKSSIQALKSDRVGQDDSSDKTASVEDDDEIFPGQKLVTGLFGQAYDFLGDAVGESSKGYYSSEEWVEVSHENDDHGHKKGHHDHGHKKKKKKKYGYKKKKVIKKKKGKKKKKKKKIIKGDCKGDEHHYHYYIKKDKKKHSSEEYHKDYHDDEHEDSYERRNIKKRDAPETEKPKNVLTTNIQVTSEYAGTGVTASSTNSSADPLKEPVLYPSNLSRPPSSESYEDDYMGFDLGMGDSESESASASVSDESDYYSDELPVPNDKFKNTLRDEKKRKDRHKVDDDEDSGGFFDGILDTISSFLSSFGIGGGATRKRVSSGHKTNQVSDSESYETSEEYLDYEIGRSTTPKIKFRRPTKPRKKDDRRPRDPWYYPSYLFASVEEKNPEVIVLPTPQPMVSIPTTPGSWLSNLNPFNIFTIFSNSIFEEESTPRPVKRVTTPAPQYTPVEEENVVKRYTDYQVIRILPRTQENVNTLIDYRQSDEAKDLVWWKGPTLRGRTDVVVPPKLVESFRDFLEYEDIPFEVSVWNLEKTIRYENPPYHSRDRYEAEISAGHPLTWMRYHRYSDIIKFLEHIQRRHRAVELIPIGTSYEGMPLVIVKMSFRNENDAELEPLKNKKKGGVYRKKPRKKKSKKAIFIEAGAHGQEWISPAVATWIIDYILQNADGNDTVLAETIQSVDWYVLPLLNPDGYEYSHQFDRLWRKNRSKTLKRDGNILQLA